MTPPTPLKRPILGEQKPNWAGLLSLSSCLKIVGCLCSAVWLWYVVQVALCCDIVMAVAVL
jgi:hypothetical protein